MVEKSFDLDEKVIVRRMDFDMFWEDLAPNPAESVLAINCQYVELMRGAVSHDLYVYGVHRDLKEVKLSQIRVPHATIYPWLKQSLPFSEDSFNYVFEFDFFEQFENLATALSEIKRVLKPEGTFVTAVPNRKSIINLITSNQAHKADLSNCQSHSLKEWAQLFEASGFTIQNVLKDASYTDFQHYYQIENRNWRKRIGNTLLSLVPLNFANQFVFFLKHT